MQNQTIVGDKMANLKVNTHIAVVLLRSSSFRSAQCWFIHFASIDYRVRRRKSDDQVIELNADRLFIDLFGFFFLFGNKWFRVCVVTAILRLVCLFPTNEFDDRALLTSTLIVCKCFVCTRHHDHWSSSLSVVMTAPVSGATDFHFEQTNKRFTLNVIQFPFFQFEISSAPPKQQTSFHSFWMFFV